MGVWLNFVCSTLINIITKQPASLYDDDFSAVQVRNNVSASEEQIRYSVVIGRGRKSC